MSRDEDQIFLQNFIIIIVMLLGMISLFVILSRVIGSNEQAIAKQRAIVLVDETRPIGSIRLGDSSAPHDEGGSSVAANAGDEGNEAVGTGEKVYKSLCTSCHGTGLPNIPQFGSKEDWADRIAQGKPLLYERAINGFTGKSGMTMPAKGGNTSLSDDEIRAAVDYMVENSQ